MPAEMLLINSAGFTMVRLSDSENVHELPPQPTGDDQGRNRDDG